MKKFTNKWVLYCKKNIFIRLIIGLLILIAGIVLLVLALIQNKNDFNELVKFEDDIQYNDENSNKRVYIDVEQIEEEPIIYYNDTTDAYYLAVAEDYNYIVYLDSYTYKKIYNKVSKNETYKLVGFSKKYSSDIKKLLKEIYNEYAVANNIELVENDEFLYNVFGNKYLDQVNNVSNKANTYIVISAFMGFFGIIITVSYIIKYKRFKKSIKKINENDINKLELEMSDDCSVFYKKFKLYLTKNYIIYMLDDFKVYKYDDILWMYISSLRGSYPNNDGILIYTKDYSQIIASTDMFTKKQKSTLNEVWNKIVSKNKNIILGYTSDNQELYNKHKQKLKNDNKSI